MKYLILLCFIFSSTAVRGADFSILDRAGNKLAPNQRNVKIETRTVKDRNNVETLEYSLTSLNESEQFYRIVCSVEFSDGKASVFDGMGPVPDTAAAYEINMLNSGVFPLVAAWNSASGIALAAGAEDHHSFLKMSMRRLPDKTVISETVQAALLAKGSVYKGKFHIIKFSPAYGERDAMARYYKLYPRRFLRNPEVDSRLYGISATYASWFRSDPEWSRFAGAEWDWGLHSGRHWGDLSGDYYDLPHEKYVEKFYFSHRDGRWEPQNLAGMPKERFRELQAQRFRDGYYCGIANTFYTTGASRIHKDMGPKFSDSLAAAHPMVTDHGYDYAASVFAFPETSWFHELMRMIKVVSERDDIGGIAFDIPLEGEVYRGPKLKDMRNVGYDQHGAGVVRGVANSKLYQAINQLPAKFGSYKLGVVANVNGIHHVNDCFYADTVMAEANPWQYAPPWPRFVRYAMGEKGATFWEGYHPEEFDANYQTWPQADKDQLIRDLGYYTAHRSFLYGVTYGAHFINEYLSNLAPAMQRCNTAGYKVVPGMKTDGKDITLTRYGNGEKSLIAVCNTGKATQNPVIEIFPPEFQSDLAGSNTKAEPLIFAGFTGLRAVNEYQGGRNFVRCEAAPIRLNILEAVGSVTAGGGKFTVQWQGGFADLELGIESEDFNGQIKICGEIGDYQLKDNPVRQLQPGQKAVFHFRHRYARIPDSVIRDMKLSDKIRIYHADDLWSREMAERIIAFFRGTGKFKNLKLEPAVDKSLPPLTAAISLDGRIPAVQSPGIDGDAGNLVVTATSREELGTITRLMLNVLNGIKYPEYSYGVTMNDTDRGIFKIRRY